MVKLFGVIKIVFGIIVLSFLVSCENLIEYKPVFAESSVQIINFRHTYSTKFEDLMDMPGTVFDARFKRIRKVKGSKTMVGLEPISFSYKGWNKYLIPDNWNLSVPWEVDVDSDGFNFRKYKGIVDTVKNLAKALPESQVKQAMKSRVLSHLDISLYTGEFKNWWYLRNLLKPGNYVKDQKLDFDPKKVDTNWARLDSAIVTGTRVRGKRECLEYRVFYTRKDSIRRDLEQLFFTRTFEEKLKARQINYFVKSEDGGPRMLEKDKWKNEKIIGEWFFSVNLNNGLLCKEAKREMAKVVFNPPTAVKKARVAVARFAEWVFEE